MISPLWTENDATDVNAGVSYTIFDRNDAQDNPDLHYVFAIAAQDVQVWKTNSCWASVIRISWYIPQTFLCTEYGHDTYMMAAILHRNIYIYATNNASQV